LKNPMNWIAKHTDTYFDWSEYYRRYRQNCLNIRRFVWGFIDKRKKGELESTIGGKADMLTVFLESPEVFTDEVLIDEILDFIGAASETTQKNIQTLMAHLIKSETDRARVRNEFSTVIKSQLEKEPSLKEASQIDFLRQTVSFDNIQDLQFLECCMKEALRFQPPGA